MPNSKKSQKEQPKPIVHCRQMRIDDKGTTTSGDDTSIQDIKVKKAECFCNRDLAVFLMYRDWLTIPEQKKLNT